jgi:hypothetical protein
MNYGKGWILMGVFDGIGRVVDVLRCAECTGSHTGHRTKSGGGGRVEMYSTRFGFLNFEFLRKEWKRKSRV